MTVDLHLSDCLTVMRGLPADSVDAIVTDPPAGISFMGKDWDCAKGGRDKWIAWLAEIMTEAKRLLKPGGHALVWALPRTAHWTATALENAGFEIREKIYHLFGTGFPKSLDISKAIDRAAGMARRKYFEKDYAYADSARPSKKAKGHGKKSLLNMEFSGSRRLVSFPATVDAVKWDGWGTALKPAVEEWILCRKPCSEKTVAANVLKFGTGALNIAACRIGITGGHKATTSRGRDQEKRGADFDKKAPSGTPIEAGRWPAHLIHDGSAAALAVFPETGPCQSGGKSGWQKGGYVGGKYEPVKRTGYNENGGSAARFFYSTKATKRDRNEGCDELPEKETYTEETPTPQRDLRQQNKRTNFHPCVKDVDLMRYLCRLITPEHGIVLDCFMGSGSTGKGAALEGLSFIGIEQDAEYFAIAQARLKHAQAHGPRLFAEKKGSNK